MDHTVGYGHIIELEIMSNEANQSEALSMLAERLAQLDVPLTPKTEFKTAFEHYQQHWPELTKNQA